MTAVTAAAATREDAPRPLEILLVGIGGQGVLTAARVLGEAAHSEGHRAVVGQLHGMSQRGGPVECTVRLHAGDGSFLLGVPDLLAAFEPLELLRALRHRGRARRILVSDTAIVPHRLAGDGGRYPDMADVLAAARRASDDVLLFPGRAMVEELGAPRTLNTALLGAMAGLGLLPFGAQALVEVANRRLPARFREVNARAFALGHGWAQQRRSEDG